MPLKQGWAGQMYHLQAEAAVNLNTYFQGKVFFQEVQNTVFIICVTLASI